MSQKHSDPKTEDIEIIKDCENNSEYEEVIDIDHVDPTEKLSSLSKDALIEILIDQQEALNENKRRCDELTILCKRVQADFDNYRKRNIENQKNIKLDAVADVVEKFLPTIDVVDQALQLIKDEHVASGIKMMRRQLMEVFTAYGVSEIEALHEEFNPKYHEAVMTEENPKHSDKVLEVFRKGYKLGDKVLRYAAVKVAK